MSQIIREGHGRTLCPVLKPLTLLDNRPIRIGRDACILGTHSRVHLPLPSPLVSRAHALIVNDGDAAYVRDLASSNGTYVNGHVVRERRLRHADLLCIGPYAFWWGAMPPPSPRPRHLADGPEMPAMVAVRGERAPHAMAGRTFLIGQRDGCDMVLDSDMVDSCHAVIYRHGRSFYLRDLNSRSGSFVNSRRVRNVELHRGDEIRIGLALARFEPPEKNQEASPTSEEALTGLGATVLADRPLLGNPAVRSCPTIEQLLGARPDRITHWENRTPRRTLDFASLS